MKPIPGLGAGIEHWVLPANDPAAPQRALRQRFAVLNASPPST